VTLNAGVAALPIPGRLERGTTAAGLLPFLAALFALVLLAPDPVAAEEEGGKRKLDNSSLTGTCRDCGVLRSIREIRTERQISRPDVYVTSQQYLETRQNTPPSIGPVFTLSWGRNEQPQTHVGAVGSPEMQQRFLEIIYEVTVRFDDGRYGLIEQDDVGDLRIGDRIQVVNKRVVRLKQ
jgi:hypothetical protein